MARPGAKSLLKQVVRVSACVTQCYKGPYQNQCTFQKIHSLCRGGLIHECLDTLLAPPSPLCR